MPGHIKTYDQSEDQEDHLKIFQAAAKTERWAMPTRCHMFKSTLTGNTRVWSDDLLTESIDIYDDLKKAFLENYLQQKKCIKDPIEIHNIKQQDGESTEDFNNGKEQPKAAKKGETFRKDKELAFLMVQPWERVARQKTTQSFSPNPEILFPSLDKDEGIEGPMIIKAEVGGHCIYRMYVDGGSASKILYEYCFSRLHPEIKNQLVPTTTPLIGFSGEIIWKIGQIQPLVKIGDEEHSTSAWMNFVVVRSSSLYNGIIRRPGVRKLQAVPSTSHGMLKLSVEGGVITLKSSRFPVECTMSPTRRNLSATTQKTIQTVEERTKGWQYNP
ncbi:reverse transcriptase domain-containing protein [Tanacetum coccineum]